MAGFFMSTTQQGMIDDSTEDDRKSTSGSIDRFVETFPALDAVPGLTHGFVLRNPEIDVAVDRDEALKRLQPHYNSILTGLKIPRDHFWTGEQVHSDSIFVVESGPSAHIPNTDGFVTATSGEYLGIFVADCGAVFIVDPVKRACGLVHSGKKGSELEISRRAIEMMVEQFGSSPSDLLVQVSPCIRPPAYEIDFAAQARKTCQTAGVQSVYDDGTCTSQDLNRYYSYRAELGKTGRMLAIVGFERTD